MEECTEITVEMWKKWKEEIREKLQETATNFVLIGYRLRQIQNSGMYDGAEDVYQFAEKEYGIGKSTTSRFIAINERYGDPEDPMKLKEEYRNFTSSKLAEMLTMTDEECELITEKTKISQVRALKHFERAEIVELENVENVKYTVFQEAIIKYFEKKEKELNKALKMIKKAAGLEEDEKESVYKEIAELINPLGSVICQRGKVFVILYEFEKGVKYKIVRERKSYHLSYREFFEEMMNIYGTFMDGSNENNVHRDFYEEYRKKVNEANLKAESEEEKTQQTGEKTECEDVATSQQNEEDLPENNSEENTNLEQESEEENEEQEEEEDLSLPESEIEIDQEDTSTSEEEQQNAKKLHVLKMLERYYTYMSEEELQILEDILEDCKRRKREYGFDDVGSTL